MFYQIANTKNGLELQVITTDEFLDTYSEKTTTPQGIGNKYQFNENDGHIYRFSPCGKTYPSVIKYENKEEAEEVLIDLAYKYGSTNGNMFMIARPTAQELLDEVDNFLDYIDGDNLKLEQELSQIRKELETHL